ncbi:MAG: GDYXXLXY domain-containing protein [Synergistaceae bacterium]|jgi:uncharacterized membrane-anchored protein|nr:GDYXXLXY domain-containing protein [Synergistaceae bacterium]
MNRARLIEILKSAAAKYAAIAVLPLIVLCYIPLAKYTILLLGTRVLLETVPADPRDILRGDYVVLDYEIANPPENMLPEETEENYIEKDVYVTLNIDKDGVGTIKDISSRRPAENLYLRGRLGRWSWSRASIDYGLGVYYVPEGTGRNIERKISDSKVLADVRILRGYSVIKGLVFVEPADDERRGTEQLWGNSPVEEAGE